MNDPNQIPTDDRTVCEDCIGESYLSDLISSTGVDARCYYCSNEAKTITIEDLSHHVERAIRDHFVPTSSEPEGYETFLAREGLWDRAGEPVGEVIAQILETDEAVAEDVREVIDERTSDLEEAQLGQEQPFEDEAHYEESSSVDHASISERYQRFETVVVEQARYFSPETRDFLASLFRRLEGHRTRDGRPVLVDVGPGTAIDGFFRARVFQDNEKLKKALVSPDQELGPPPPRLGRAGRLNAAGVSIFYGAETAEVALAEVRPPVGSKALMARFIILRPLRLLDVDALKSILVEGSLFDPEHIQRLEHAAFLESFSTRFTQPVMPDNEAFEYIPTQAIADYLANEVEPVLDGILYSSPQAGRAGRNVALFHRSSRVDRIVLPGGAKSDVWFGNETEDGFEIEYQVFETVPAPVPPPPDPRPRRPMLAPVDFDDHPNDPDERVAALRIDLDTVEVRHINAVDVRGDTHRVTRTRHQRGQERF